MSDNHYKVLSLDGGGIKGLLVAEILENIELERQGFMKEFDMFAGTSTGSVLACAFAMGMTPDDAVEMYINLGPVIFEDSYMDNIRDLGMIVGAQYGSMPLYRELRKVFGIMTLDDLDKKVLVAAFDIQGDKAWKPKFFHNFEGEDSDGDELVVDVIMRSTAAPIFFPTWGHYIDGGVVANNPSMCAVTQVMREKPDEVEFMSLLSMGTGGNPMSMKASGSSMDWGILQWMPEILYIMMDGGVGVAHTQAKYALGHRYHRINPELPDKIGLDEWEKWGILIDVADNFDLTDVLKWVDYHHLGDR